LETLLLLQFRCRMNLGGARPVPAPAGVLHFCTREVSCRRLFPIQSWCVQVPSFVGMATRSIGVLDALLMSRSLGCRFLWRFVESRLFRGLFLDALSSLAPVTSAALVRRSHLETSHLTSMTPAEATALSLNQRIQLIAKGLLLFKWWFGVDYAVLPAVFFSSLRHK
jgi:hypothetical protein